MFDYPEIEETKLTRLILACYGAVPPKIAKNLKKASQLRWTMTSYVVKEEPVTKGKRVKRLVKKSSTKPITCIVIRQPLVETKSKGKEKEKVDVAHGKGIELLSKVAWTEKAQLKEVRKKSLRDFHKTHPSGSGTGVKKPPSVEKITPTVTSEGTSDKPGVPDVTEDDSTKSESNGQENESEEQESDSKQDEESDDDNQEEEDVDQENESEDDEIESDEDKGMDDTTEQFDNDVDARLKEPTQTGKEVVQGEGADVEMNEAQQGNAYLVTTQEQVVDDAHVTITTVTKKTEVLVTSSSCSSDLASKFLNFSDIPQTDAEIVSPLDAHVHHEVLRTQAPTLLTIPVSVITESSHCPNFAPPVIKKLIKESRDEVTLAKVSSQPQSTYEAASTLTEFELNEGFFLTDGAKSRKDKDKDEDPSTGSDRGLKKRKLSKDAEPTTGPKKKDSTSGSSKGTKSQPKSSGKSVQSEEPVFEVADSDMPQDQERNLGDNENEPRNETTSRSSTSTDKSLKDFDELMSTLIDFSGYILNGLKIKNLTQEILLGPAFRLLKGTRSNYAELEYDFKECYKALLEKLDWEHP
ncbi:hypothetical protein Tco_1392012 [Tanacetum coccineum]